MLIAMCSAGTPISCNAAMVSLGVTAAAISMPRVIDCSALFHVRPMSTAKVLPTSYLLDKSSATQPHSASPANVWAEFRIGSRSAGDRALRPADWTSYAIDYRFRETTYHLEIELVDDDAAAQVIALDGQPVAGIGVPLVDDARPHRVQVRTGRSRSETDL